MVNDREYWNRRFATDWDLFGGSEQTRVFARMLVDNLPTRMTEEIVRDKLSIADLGCAQGECVAFLKERFPGSSVIGYDFSRSAIASARRNHPDCEFCEQDILDWTGCSDVVISSNVLEHLKNPLVVLEDSLQHARRYFAVLVPFREPKDSGIEEHVNRFHLSDFRTSYLGFRLISKRVICPLKGREQFWPYEQLLVVYERLPETPESESSGDIMNALADMAEMQLDTLANLKGREEDVRSVREEMCSLQKRIDSHLASLIDEKKSLQSANEVLRQGREDAEREIARLSAEHEALQKESALIQGEKGRAENEIVRQEREIAELILERDALKEVNASLLEEKIRLEEGNRTAERKIAQLSDGLVVRKAQEDELTAKWRKAEDERKWFAEHNALARQELEKCQHMVADLTDQVSRHQMAEDAVLKYMSGFVGNTSSRVVNLLKHVQFQLFHGGVSGKKEFARWLQRALRRKNVPDARFNPFWDIYDVTRRTFDVCRKHELQEVAGEEMPVVPPRFSQIDVRDEYRRYDVLFFSVIDYDFRYQRPQQIADDYARKGHRVFYFNVNFGVGERPSVTLRKENLYVVTLNFSSSRTVHVCGFEDVRTDLERQLSSLLEEYAVLDSLAISEYPNWIDAVRFVRHRHSFANVLDYLDDYDGFTATASDELKKNTAAILSESDHVVASSLYLKSKAERHAASVSLVRNGTEFGHFNQAACVKEEPGLRRPRKIGYYGAIAHWFDFGKIEALAQAFPKVQIELIGAVSEDVSRFTPYKNVKFLGEKSYSELPAYLKGWDVALIPFDTSTSLIQATNPVKFYEYLSAGKKVVATEIPEIAEFAGRYVLLANDDKTFVSHVRACLDGTDGLNPSDDMMAFARENDWGRRVDAFSADALALVPKFSIVVLTFNQLEYTKLCLNSILQWTAYPNYEVIVVDNASTDGTPQYLKEMATRYPQIRIKLNKENLGFAAGNNVGLRAATGDYLMLLNNDVIVTRGWLSRFLAQFRANPKAGAIGPVSNSIWDAAMIPAMYESVEQMERFALERVFDHAFESREAENLAMYCFVISRKTFETVGPVSEEYGRGMFEDDDYCAALASHGLQLVGAEDVFIHHFLSASFNKLKNEDMLALHARNRNIFEKKWNRKWALHPFREGVTGGTNEPLRSIYPKIRDSGVELGYYACKRFDLKEEQIGAFIRAKRTAGGYKGVYVIPSVWWNVPIFQRSQQMALAFRRAGYLVIYIEKPDGDSVAGTVRNFRPGLYVCTVNDFDVALSGVSGCIVSLYSTAFEICSKDSKTLTRDFMERNTVFYEYIDHFDEKISGGLTQQLREFYAKLVHSDWPVRMVASARNLMEELRRDSGRKVLYVPNGVDAVHYSAENLASIARRVTLPDCLNSDRIRIGYFGAMALWLDYELLDEVSAVHPEWDFVFIGPDYSGGASKLPQRANCHWLGPVPYADLPYYASRFDVAILPFQGGELAKSTSPLKLFEYFALGIPVVVTADMSECTAFKEVLSGKGADDFAKALSKALARRSNLDFENSMRKLAQQNTWDERASKLISTGSTKEC